MLGIRQVKVVGHPVHERIDPEPFSIGGNRNVDREWDLCRIPDRGYFLGGPDAIWALLDQPDLGGERGRSHGPVLPGRQRPANFKWGPGYAQYLSRLHALEVPDHHG